MAPSEPSTHLTPMLMAVIELATPVPRVSWKWARNSVSGKASNRCERMPSTCLGLAWPVVSPSIISWAPSSW